MTIVRDISESGSHQEQISYQKNDRNGNAIQNFTRVFAFRSAAHGVQITKRKSDEA